MSTCECCPLERRAHTSTELTRRLAVLGARVIEVEIALGEMEPRRSIDDVRKAQEIIREISIMMRKAEQTIWTSKPGVSK